MNNKLNIAVIAATVVLLIGALSYVYTAPYTGNQGLSRTPGVRIGGTDTAPRGHCQVDVEQAGSAPDEAMTHSSASDAGHLSPDTKGLCSQEPMMDGPQEVAADTKEILDGAVHREKPLRVRGGLETPHLAFPLPGWLVRDFGPVVRVPVRPVDHGRALSS